MNNLSLTIGQVLVKLSGHTQKEDMRIGVGFIEDCATLTGRRMKKGNEMKMPKIHYV